MINRRAINRSMASASVSHVSNPPVTHTKALQTTDTGLCTPVPWLDIIAAMVSERQTVSQAESAQSRHDLGQDHVPQGSCSTLDDTSSRIPIQIVQGQHSVVFSVQSVSHGRDRKC